MIPPLQPETKVQELCTQIRKLAYEQGPGGKLPKVRELCTMFHASRVSLYEALDELEMQNILYREQSKGIFVSQKLYRKSICILLDTSLLLRTGASPFWGVLWGHFAAATEQRAREKNEYYSLYLVPRMKEDEPRLPEEVEHLIQSERIHGVLAVGFPAAFNELIMQKQVPCVTFAEGGHWLVSLNMIEMIRLGVRSLVEQGCKNIALWSPVYQYGNHERPIVGYGPLFASLLENYGGVFRPELVRDTWRPQFSEDETAISTFQEQGFQNALEVFTDTTMIRPDGIVVTDDMMTEGLLAALQTLGLRVGYDVKVATHANKGLMMLFRHIKGMTVIEFNPDDIVHAMFSMLDQLLIGQQPEQRLVEITPRVI